MLKSSRILEDFRWKGNLSQFPDDFIKFTLNIGTNLNNFFSKHTLPAVIKEILVKTSS